MVKWRQIKIQTIPRQLADVRDRLDELVMGGTGLLLGDTVGGGIGVDLADVSPNLIYNAGFEDWTGADCDYWQSAAANDWAAVLKHYAQESTPVYSLPYSVKLGDGVNTGRGIAQTAAFRVVPSEAYYLSVRLLGADATAEYIVILKALLSDGVTEITTGTPLGTGWTYSAGYGGWIITGTPGITWTRISAPITLGSTVCYLRASIQYYQNATTKYLYADDFAITRGSQLPAFNYHYLADSEIPPTPTPSADAGTNLIHNGAFDFWGPGITDEPEGWISAQGTNWDYGTPTSLKTSTAAFVYSLPFSVKLGDGSNRSGIAQDHMFPVVPSESYYLSARILGLAGTYYALCLRVYDSSRAQIVGGSPLGAAWTYSGLYNAWIVTGATTTSYQRFTQLLTLDDDTCFLQASIQYHSGGAFQYIYLDDFAITRGAALPAFTDNYITTGLLAARNCFGYFMETPHGTGLSSDLIPSALAGSTKLTIDPATEKVYYDGVELSSLIAGVSGTGTLNYIPKWSGATSLTDSRILDDGTDVFYNTFRYHVFRVDGSANYRGAIYSDGSFGVVWSERSFEMDYNHGVPGTPTANRVRLFTDTDKKLYYKDDVGLVTGPLGVGVGGGTVTGTGTTNYLSKWSGVTALTDSRILDNNTDVFYNTVRYHVFRVDGSANYRAAVYSDGVFGVLWSERSLEMDYYHGVPGTATVNTCRLYFHTDKKLYYKDDAGLITGPILTGGGGTVSGSGTVNTIPLWTPSTSNLGDSILKQTTSGIYTVLDAFQVCNNKAISWTGPANQPNYSGIKGTSAGSALRLWNTYNAWEFRSADSDSSGLTWLLTGNYLQFPDGTKQYTAGGGGGGVGGSGTLNYLPKWITTTTLGNSRIFDDGTNIISTATYHIFKVTGSANYRAAVYSDGSFGVLWSERTLEMDYTHGVPGPATPNTSRLYFGADKQLYSKTDGGLIGGPLGVRGSVGITVTPSGGYVDVTTGLASVSGAVVALDYDLSGSDFLTTTVRPNVPSAGKLRIWGKKISGGSSGLTVYWMAW